jgi:ABC-type dipeptide/oligopeptide/nickel transport system permease subunit
MAIGVGGISAIIVLAIVGPFVAPYDPDATSPIGLHGPSASHLLGTTLSGQDVLSQFLVAARPSVIVGVVAASIATALSVVFGILSGYLSGGVSETLSLATNIFLVLPTLPLLIVATAYLPNSSYLVLSVVIGLTGWSWGARVIRAQTLSLKTRDYVLAARATGESLHRIALYELMPPLIPIIAASFLFTVAYAIVTEAGLAFLGLGNLSEWTWGTMLYWTQNDSAYMISAWWWYAPPGLAIALVGLFLAFINFGLDERVNTRLRDRPAAVPLWKRARRPLSRAKQPRRGGEGLGGDESISHEAFSG